MRQMARSKRVFRRYLPDTFTPKIVETVLLSSAVLCSVPKEIGMSRRWSAILTLFLLLPTLLSACGSGKAGGVKLASESALPENVRNAPERVRTAYRFAVANPDALKNVPCYCGCGAIGHKSNLACYVREFDSGGKPVFDDHALGCSICVDIAQDVMNMTAEGRAPADIRAQIVATYSKFGPPNQ
jgi:Protein of unknown function with PCYCGC motif